MNFIDFISRIVQDMRADMVRPSPARSAMAASPDPEALARAIEAEKDQWKELATGRHINYEDGLCEGLDVAAAIVRNHPAASPWIPMSERLPEQGQHVLTLPHHDGIPWPAKFNGGAYLDPVFGGAMVVTHWTPLPAPPEP